MKCKRGHHFANRDTRASMPAPHWQVQSIAATMSANDCRRGSAARRHHSLWHVHPVTITTVISMRVCVCVLTTFTYTMHGRCHIDMNPNARKIETQMRYYKQASTWGQRIIAILQRRELNIIKALENPSIKHIYLKSLMKRINHEGVLYTQLH